MGIQLNFGDHSPKWKNFFTTIQVIDRPFAQWARSQAKAIANTRPSANNYFRSLPAHRTLSALLDDRRIWVDYFTGGADGYHTFDDGIHEVGIGYWGFRTKENTLATLIHELAHVGGAPGEGFQAESAVYFCGLGTLNEYSTGIDDLSTPYRPDLGG